MNRYQAGNAFVYILIAVVLFGALMFSISSTTESDAPQSEMADSKAKIAANDILAYAAVATNAVTQMDQSGIDAGQIDFMYPDDTNFNTAPTIYKLFHPDGGGLNYKPLPNFASDGSTVVVKPGYYIGRFNNITWTPTATQDVMFTAYGLTKPVCEAINLKVRGDATIPSTTGGDVKSYLVAGSVFSGSNVDLDISVCSDCEDIPSMCISGTSSGTIKYAFYNILVAE